MLFSNDSYNNSFPLQLILPKNKADHSILLLLMHEMSLVFKV